MPVVGLNVPLHVTVSVMTQPEMFAVIGPVVTVNEVPVRVPVSEPPPPENVRFVPTCVAVTCRRGRGPGARRLGHVEDVTFLATV